MLFIVDVESFVKTFNSGGNIGNFPMDSVSVFNLMLMFAINVASRLTRELP